MASHLQTRYFRDIFDFFIKYVGSSAYRAPAFMNSLPTIQFRYDLWYVDGGLYHLALGLGRLMDELGIKINLNAEVSEVRRDGARVTGLVANGNFHPADILVSNMEVIPAYESCCARTGRSSPRSKRSTSRRAPGWCWIWRSTANTRNWRIIISFSAASSGSTFTRYFRSASCPRTRRFIW